MTTARLRYVVARWHFQCPECGMGDDEIGQLAADDEIYCEVCVTESDLYVRLHRWSAETDEAELLGGQAPGQKAAA